MVAPPDYSTAAPYIRPEGKPQAVICDIDGTLADFSPVSYADGKKKWDYSGIPDAPAHDDVIDILRRIAVNNTRVIYMTGCPSEQSKTTIMWLAKNVKLGGMLLMRETGDYRPDYVIKLELFNDKVREDYDVLCALDDRDQVVKLWRAIGIRCLQVRDGNF